MLLVVSSPLVRVRRLVARPSSLTGETPRVRAGVCVAVSGMGTLMRPITDGCDTSDDVVPVHASRPTDFSKVGCVVCPALDVCCLR